MIDVLTCDLVAGDPPVKVGTLTMPVPNYAAPTWEITAVDHDGCPGDVDLPVYVRDHPDVVAVGTLTCCTDCQPTTEPGA